MDRSILSGQGVVRRIGIVGLLFLVATVPLRAESGGDDSEKGFTTHPAVVSKAAPAPPARPVPKLRVAVLDFENKVPNGQSDIGWGMAEMLISELKKTGRYTVLERAALSEILGEQDFTHSGRVQRGQQLKIGRIKGAQLLIKGAVTEFSYNVRNRNMGFGYKGVGIGWTEARARVAADIRLIDAMTGEIIASHDQAAEVKATGADLAGTVGNFSFSAGGSDNHPLGQAVRQLIGKMVKYITSTLDTGTIEVLVSEAFEGRVVKADGPDRIVINRGSADGVRVGDRFKVSRVTEELTDPETGEVLGQETIQLGEIVVTAVKERWAEAKALSGSDFQRNDRVTR
ncbi:MAG: hypothetical protein D6679_11500 [Candidatus Hydrogenedentota bacterium]|nr:MAG: hypothetical protein D6679_11500 [Candidatus Hydrogenedentota bacterium]